MWPQVDYLENIDNYGIRACIGNIKLDPFWFHLDIDFYDLLIRKFKNMFGTNNLCKKRNSLHNNVLPN